MNASTTKKTNQKTPVKKPPLQAKALKAALPGFFEKPGKQVFYTAIAAIAVMAFIVFKDFLLFNKAYLYKDIGSDSLNACYPNMVAAAQYIKSYGGLSWSFNLGMGQDITPYAFYDPFDFVLYLFTPAKMIWLLGYKEYFKFVLTGIVFYSYLRTLGISKYSSLAGSLMFCFCGFMIIGSSWWFAFSFEAFCAALLLLGFELLFKRNKPWLFPLAIFLIAISNPFNLGVYAIFLSVYAIFRSFNEGRKSIKAISYLFLMMVGLGLIGIAVSAPVFIEQLKAMLESPRGSGPDSYAATLSAAPVFKFIDIQQLGTCIERFFCSGMVGTGTNYAEAIGTNTPGNFRGWENMMEAPAFYCGIPCLLLAPLLFGYFNKKQKIIFGAVLGLWLLPILFPWFRYALWFFTGDYYRTYSLFISLIFIIYSVICLDKLLETKKINLVLLSSITIGLILLQSIPYFNDSKTIVTGLSIAAKLFVIVYAAIILWLVKAEDKQPPKYAFLILLGLELTTFSYITINRGTNVTAADIENKTGYSDYSIEAVNFIKSREHSFFRVDKNFGSSPAITVSYNDAMVDNYYGTSSYNSFNQKYYIQYLRDYGIISLTREHDSRWVKGGLLKWPILESLNCVKYLFTKGNYSALLHHTHDSLTTMGGIEILRNKYTLPFGFAYSKYIRASDFEKLTRFQKTSVSLRAAPVNDSDAGRLKGLYEFHLQDTISPSTFNLNIYKKLRDSLAEDSLQVDSFGPVHISGKIALKTAKLIFITVPYDAGWHTHVDGKEYKPVLIANGMMGIAPGIGQHTILMEYKPPYRTEALWCSATGILLWGGLTGFTTWKNRKNKIS